MQEEKMTKEQLLDELKAIRARNIGQEGKNTNAELENALRESKDNLDLFLELVPVAVAMFDRDMKYIHCSRKWKKDYGLNDRDIIGLSHYEVFPGIPARWREMHQRCLAGAIEKCEEEHITWPDGRSEWVRGEIRPWLDYNVDIGGIIIFRETITERKLLSERTSQSEKKFRAMFENAHDAIFLVSEDDSFLDCNPAATELFRCEKINIVGKTIFDFTPSVQADGEDSRQKALGMRKTSVQGKAHYFEWLCQRPDGTQFEALIGVNHIDLNGEMTALATVRDISARKRAEEELRASESRFRALVETTNDCIWEVDENEIYTYASPQVYECLGYKPAEVTGKTLYDFVIPEQVVNFRSKLDAYKMERKPFFVLEKESLHKNGNTVIIETSGVPVFDKAGNFSGYRGIDRNITNRKMMEQKFLQAQKMEVVGQLASGIAHDFNNIIMAIKGYVNLLIPRMDKDPDGKQCLQRISSLAKRAKILTQNLLSFSRKKESKPKPNDLNEIVRNMKNILTWLIGDGIRFKMMLHCEVLPIMSVAGQIEQVLINVVTNARDATPKDGLIAVSTSFVDGKSVLFKPVEDAGVRGYALLSIADTGTGMDEATKLKMFEPFFTLKEVGKGTGLGLAVVYGVIKHHGGFVNVDSRQGEGTTFNIYIPLIDERV